MKEYLGIKIHDKDPIFITELSKSILSDGYVKDGETIPEAFARAATALVTSLMLQLRHTVKKT